MEADQIESENYSLKKVKAAHVKAERELNGDSQMSARHNQVKDNLSQLKSELREKQNQYRAEEKILQQEHAEIIEMETK